VLTNFEFTLSICHCYGQGCPKTFQETHFFTMESALLEGTNNFDDIILHNRRCKWSHIKRIFKTKQRPSLL